MTELDGLRGARRRGTGPSTGALRIPSTWPPRLPAAALRRQAVRRVQLSSPGEHEPHGAVEQSDGARRSRTASPHGRHRARWSPLTGMAAISAARVLPCCHRATTSSHPRCAAARPELFGLHLHRFGIDVSLVDTSDPNAVRQAIRPNTKLLYVETPANRSCASPTLRRWPGWLTSDPFPWPWTHLGRAGHPANPERRRGFVIHHAPSILNGHGGALGGACGRSDALHRIRRDALVHLGGAASPFNAWRSCAAWPPCRCAWRSTARAALQVGQLPGRAPQGSGASSIRGFPPDPQHALAARQMSAGGGMITFELKGGLGAAINLAERAALGPRDVAGPCAQPALLLSDGPVRRRRAWLSVQQKASIREWTGEGIVREHRPGSPGRPDR